MSVLVSLCVAHLIVDAFSAQQSGQPQTATTQTAPAATTQPQTQQPQQSQSMPFPGFPGFPPGMHTCLGTVARHILDLVHTLVILVDQFNEK